MADNMECENASFGYALMALKNGYTAKRLDWDTPGVCVKMQFPDQHSKMTRPYLYIEYDDGNKCPWVPYIEEIMAEDWVVYK